jgi:deazaflavin-dependent oxidoreductase (nitroreductase family)
LRSVNGPSRPGANAGLEVLDGMARPYLTTRQISPYDHPMRVATDSRLGKAVIKMAGSKTFMRVGPKIVPHMDRFLHKVTGGKVVMSAGMLPSLVLTTTGAKSGQKRTTPLATKPEGDHWYVVGSNFGREKHPAWTANLMAHPDAEVSYKGKTTLVRAHLLTAEEKAEVWPKLVDFYPNYDVYVERSGRDIRVFRLDPR